jgi:hypothetical protein
LVIGRTFCELKGALAVRRLILLPIAAAALATGAVATWGPGLENPPRAAPDRNPPAAISSRQASEAGRPSPSGPVAAAPRYRADACSGDYVCYDGGAWEPAEGASAEVRHLTSDGF